RDTRWWWSGRCVRRWRACRTSPLHRPRPDPSPEPRAHVGWRPYRRLVGDGLEPRGAVGVQVVLVVDDDDVGAAGSEQADDTVAPARGGRVVDDQPDHLVAELLA